MARRDSHPLDGGLVGRYTNAVYAEKCQSRPYDLESIPGYEHDKYAPDQRERMFDGKAFIASVDDDDDDTGDGNPDLLAQPQWVAYEIKQYKKTGGEFDKIVQWDRPKWYSSDFMSEEKAQTGVTSRSIDDSYRGVGKVYHRGHLAMRDHASMMGPKYGCNSHIFMNAVPQLGAMNTNIWLDLEKYTGAMANKFGRVWIVAGPIFDGPFQTIGDPGEVPVAIPEALFKVIVWEENGKLEAMSFIFQNEANPLFKKVKHPAASSGALKRKLPFIWGNLSPKPPNKDAIPPHRKQWGILA